MTQEKRVIEIFIVQQYVSRNYFLDLPYDKITRLSGIIFDLRNKGWDITTENTERDTLYKVNPYCVGYQEELKN